MGVNSNQTINIKYCSKKYRIYVHYTIFSTYAKTEKSLSKRIYCLLLFFACLYYIRALYVCLHIRNIYSLYQNLRCRYTNCIFHINLKSRKRFLFSDRKFAVLIYFNLFLIPNDIYLVINCLWY